MSRHWDRRLARMSERWRGEESVRPKVKKEKKTTVQSSSESVTQLQSLPGLVEEDVSRLRVLGDV